MFIVYGAFCAGDGAAVSTLWLTFVNEQRFVLRKSMYRSMKIWWYATGLHLPRWV